ncbi:unnamed protein product [marine sediment metagenome]|uniref:Uncharacterized protein n=1 Tax=marine sediment metagenome TaxID=412755 RepID=X1U3B4_9ZZZZ
MRLIRLVFILFALALISAPVSCTKMTGPEKDVIIKISARRIAYQGLKAQPDVFIILGSVARESCQLLTDKPGPSDIAFSIIFRTIATKTQDPLLAQDIQDVAELIGLKFDPDFNLLGLTPGQLDLVTLFVCSFAQGVEAGI